jgi:hypothetical protein
MGNGTAGGPNSVTATNVRANLDLGQLFHSFISCCTHDSYREEQGLTRERFHCVGLSDINFERVPSKGNITEQ